MLPKIETINSKKLIGKRVRTSLMNDRTGELWRSFIPHKKEIRNTISPDMIAMRVYDPLYSFKDFNPHAEFDKWAAIEVSDFDHVPDGMETFELPGGLYAVFLYKGAASAGASFFQYMYQTQAMNWITVHTLNYWERSTKTKIPNQKKRFLCLSDYKKTKNKLRA